MAASWVPATYLGFADERSRPYADLLARVSTDPATVTDLGCGPGHLSALLRARWPLAVIEGVDASAEMIEHAMNDNTDPHVSYRRADLRAWRATEPVDLVISNATLQWVPGHLDLLSGLADQVAEGGSLAFSVPGNFDTPSHVLLHELAGREPYAPHTRGIEQPHGHDAATYLATLARPGWHVDAWETTYLHLLHGRDPVLRWMTGTGARPVLEAMPGELRERFATEYATRLRAAYPEQPHGTVLPFRRVFCVAQREEGGLAVRVHHVQVSCPAGGEDVARRFWGEALGLDEVDKPPQLATRGGVWFRGDTVEVHVGVEGGFTPARKAHPAFAVDDLDAVASRLTSLGYPVAWDHDLTGYRRFYTHDGHGNRVELLTPAVQTAPTGTASPPVPGK